MSTSEMSVEEAIEELEGFINFFDTYYEEISEYSDYEYEDTKRQCEATKIVLQELRRLQEKVGG